jgi:predicted 3-demethylubiquinone-9 3-methyltransferase (glyoxalase superfamily)
MTTTITPFLWFDSGKAQEAAEFYCSIFPDSRIDHVDKSPANNPSTKEGEVLTVDFTLAGRSFTALNGGPDFHFSEAVSLAIDCKDQAEIDRYWELLTADGGEPSVCGWLKDKYGFSWQVTPHRLIEMNRSPNRDGARRAFEAMLTMTKIDLAQLERAFEGETVGAR